MIMILQLEESLNERRFKNLHQSQFDDLGKERCLGLSYACAFLATICL